MKSRTSEMLSGLLVVTMLLSGGAPGAPRKQGKAQAAAAAAAKKAAAKKRKPKPLRAIRVAVFDLDVLQGVGIEPAALTDQVNTINLRVGSRRKSLRLTHDRAVRKLQLE